MSRSRTCALLILMLCCAAAIPVLAVDDTVPTTGEFLRQIAQARHLDALNGLMLSGCSGSPVSNYRP